MENKTIQTKTTCPYCGFENPHVVMNIYGPQLINCNVEEGGCDAYYAVSVEVHYKFTTYFLEKINER